MLLKRAPASALLLALCCIFSTQIQAEDREPGDRAQAPSLRAEDLGGQWHALDDYRGQVVVVNFWASWCAPCLIEMPGLQRLAKNLESQAFSVLAVNAGETAAEVWKMRRRLGWELPLLLDRGGETVVGWKVDSYPTSFVIDAEGHVRHRIVGMLEWDSAAARGLIEALLAEQADKTMK